MSTKMKNFKRSISALLAFIFLFTAVFSGVIIPSSALAPSVYTDIAANTSASVVEAKYFRFIPTESGSYTFYSSNKAGDPYGVLLDSDGNELVRNDDSGDTNFSITYNCIVGNVYYIYARYYNNGSGSYTFNVIANFALSPSTPPAIPEAPAGDVVITSGANTYSLFNSGATSSDGYEYSSTSNIDDRSYTNGGYDIYGESPWESDLTCGLGLSFTVSTEITETASLTVYAYDIDEESDQIDDIYLVNDSTGERTFIGNLQGRDSAWSTTVLSIDQELFEVGQSYHFEVDICQNGWWTWVRRVSLDTVCGEYIPSDIFEYSFGGEISEDGRVYTDLSISTNEDTVYYLEYTATINNEQKGGVEGYTITGTADGSSLSVDFDLEYGAPTGVYQITVILKDAAGNTRQTYSFAAGYDYSAVTYDANGGSQNLPTDSTTYSSGDTVTVKFDRVPSLYGYVFLGWSTDRYAIEPEYTQDGVNSFTIGSSDVTLYAVWASNICDHEWAEASRTDATCTADGLVVNTCSLCGETEEVTLPMLGHDYVDGVCSRCEDVRDGKALLVEDILPWSSNANSVTLQLLVDSGVIEAYEKCSSSDIANGSIDLNDYALVVLAADQHQDFYNNVSSVDLASYVENGGSLFLAADTAGHTSGTYSVFPFGITSVRTSAGYNYIVDDTHPMITGIYSDNHVLQNSDMYGSSISHNYFLNYPEDTNVILTDSSGYATLLEFEYGSGLVVVSGLTFECGYTSHWGFFEGYDDIFVHLYNHSNSGNAGHRHSFVETLRIDATCTTDGRVESACDCGETKVEIISTLGHDFHITSEVAASCTADGYIVMTCQRAGCEHSKQQAIIAAGHSFGDDNICDVCQFELIVHSHEYTATVVEPTCTQIGYTLYTCICGHEYRADLVDQLGHTWNEGEVVVEKTCDTDGSMRYTCTVCEATYDVVIRAGHNWSETVTVEATCTTDGSVTRTCEGCGASETETIPAAHTWDDGEIITEATCTESGEKLCVCAVCGISEHIEIAVLGHYFLNGTCERCGAGINDVVEPDGDHPEYGMYFAIDDIISRYGPEYINEYGVLLDYNEDAVIKKVAVYLTQEGTMWRRCIAVVGENITYATYVPYLSYDETIHYTGLNSDWINVFRLSENGSGIWTYSDYATIGVNLEDAQGNLLLSLYDIGQAGEKTRIFDDLDEMIAWLSEDTDCIYHQEGNWYTEIYETCGTEGLKYTYCTVCGTRIEEIIPANGYHYESNWITDVEATCGVDGLMHTECYDCGQILQTEEIPATEEHIPGDWIVDTAPTGISSGTRHLECIECHTVMETDIIDMLATLKIEDITARSGSVVSVTLDVRNNPGIIGAALTFDFDPALKLVSATAGEAWSLLTLTAPGSYDSPCTFVWDGIDTSDYANGTIIILNFEIPDDAALGSVYDISASYTFGNMINAELELVDMVIENGSITVDTLMGDANADGIVDVADVIVLRRYMSSGYDVTVDEAQADMDNDGIITMADIILLRRYINNGAI